MKRLIILNGAMGAGKTATGQALKKLLPPCAFLDGDWCWDMEPFQVNETTKELVQENIAFLLNQFLRCPAYEAVIFCWVLHTQEILDGLLARLDLAGAEVRVFTLMLTEETLRAHIDKDVKAGLRTPDVLDRSLARLPLYDRMPTEKIWVDGLTVVEAAERIAESLAPGQHGLS